MEEGIFMQEKSIIKAVAALSMGTLLLCSCASNTQQASVSTVVSSEESSQAPSFLASHSEQDLQYLFTMISSVALPNIPDATDPYPYYGFQDTSKLSSNGLYNFFLVFCDDKDAISYWHEEDNRYYIPLSFVRKTLDRYFEGYEFNPEDITYECGYQAKEQVFVTPGIAGHDVRKDGVKITETEQNANGDITIEAKKVAFDYQAKDTDTEILVIRPTETGFHFISYQIIMVDHYTFDFTDSLGFKVVKWVGSPPIRSSVIDDKIAQLDYAFDLINYGCLRIAIDDGGGILDIPDKALTSEETVDIKGVSVKISHSSSDAIQASWTKNGYAFALYMRGEQELSEENFIKSEAEYFIEEIQLSPDHCGITDQSLLYMQSMGTLQKKSFAACLL